jgi:uncharacterized membrane protein YphA (DoxX/SURF4 family)
MTNPSQNHKKGIFMAFLVLLARLGVAGLFLVSGIQKIVHPAAFATQVENLLPKGRLQRNLLFALPLVEVILASLFLLDIAPKLLAASLAVLLAIFTAALLYGWRARKISDCGCSRKPLPATLALLRNAVLLAACLWCLHSTDGLTGNALAMLLEAVAGGAVALFALRSARPKAAGHPSAHPATRRRVLQKGLGVGLAALLVTVARPALTAFAFVCNCSCNRTVYSYWTDCVCGVTEMYQIEDTYCCQLLSELCDSWTLGVGFEEC